MKDYEVIEEVFPHDAPLHDFPYDARSARECPRRLLCSPYKGCSHDCVYCYANTKPYNPWRKGKVVVFVDYLEKVLSQLNRLKIIFPIYMSQDHDPFAPIEAKYQINMKLIENFVKMRIPFEFITKSANYMLRKVLNIINGYDRVFAQFSITSLNEELRKRIEPNAGSINGRLSLVEEYSECGIPVVVRVDPILPFINDDLSDLRELISLVADLGAKHIITSILDIDLYIWENLKEFFANEGMEDLINKYVELYFIKGDEIKGYLHASEDYRLKMFAAMRDISSRNGLTFALCQEFRVIKSRTYKRYESLNDKFMTSIYCEGIPLHPLLKTPKGLIEINCVADCIRCILRQPICGLDILKGGLKIRPRDLYMEKTEDHKEQ